jgi:hypothetical protein
MIRNVVIHLLSEQPVIADLLEPPTPGDVSLLCTNLRTKDGKRPVFIDRMDSTFVFPYLHIRFIEIPPVPSDPVRAGAGDPETPAAPAGADEGDLEIDQDFLRRIRDA